MFKVVKNAVREQKEIINENIQTNYLKNVFSGCMSLTFGLKFILSSIISSFDNSDGFMASFNQLLSIPIMFVGIVLVFVSYICFKEALKVDITKHLTPIEKND